MPTGSMHVYMSWVYERRGCRSVPSAVWRVRQTCASGNTMATTLTDVQYEYTETHIGAPQT